MINETIQEFTFSGKTPLFAGDLSNFQQKKTYQIIPKSRSCKGIKDKTFLIKGQQYAKKTSEKLNNMALHTWRIWLLHYEEMNITRKVIKHIRSLRNHKGIKS